MANTVTLLVTVAAIIAITVALYYVSYMLVGSDVSTEYVHRGEIDAVHEPKEIRVPASKMNKIAGYSDYSFAMWFYINDFQTGFGKNKILMRRGTGSNVNPAVYLDAKTNTMTVAMGYQTPSGESKRMRCQVPNVPVQRWSHLAVNVMANGLNVYLNGRLFRGCSAPSGQGPVVSPGSAPLEILPRSQSNGEFGGKLSGILFRSKTMTADEINALYHAGPGSSSTGLLDAIFGVKKIQFVFNDSGRDSIYSVSL